MCLQSFWQSNSTEIVNPQILPLSKSLYATKYCIYQNSLILHYTVIFSTILTFYNSQINFTYKNHSTLQILAFAYLNNYVIHII